MSTSNVLRTFPKDTIWSPWGSPDLGPREAPIWRPGYVPKWRSGDVSIWRQRDVPGRLIRDFPRMFSGCPLKDLQNMSLGRYGVICWMSLNFFLLFFRNLFYWQNLSKNNSILKVYLEHIRTSKTDLFSKISECFLSVNYFCEKISS